MILDCIDFMACYSFYEHRNEQNLLQLRAFFDES